MSTWTNEELNKIEKAEELDISSMRSDGTLRNLVTIWVVRVGDDLYIRSVKGRSGPWFRGTQTRHEGTIQSGGVEKKVTFEDADPGLNDEIDKVYRSKYRTYSADIVDPVLTAEARQSTLRLVPRES